MARGGKQPGAGRPKGSTTKVRVADHLSEDEMKQILLKAKEMALAGNEAMIKFLGDHYYGKAIQPVEGDFKGKITITFDNAFTASSETNSGQ